MSNLEIPLLKISTFRLMSVGLVLSSCIGFDQTTKRIAEKVLGDYYMHSYFYDMFRLQYIQNQGAFLGFGAGFSDLLKFWLFLILPLVFLLSAALFILFSSKLKESQALLIALIIGGGVGNLIDRLLIGGVTDFLNIGIGSLRTGIFNIADVAIMAGAIGLFFSELVAPKASESEKCSSSH